MPPCWDNFRMIWHPWQLAVSFFFDFVFFLYPQVALWCSTLATGSAEGLQTSIFVDLPCNCQGFGWPREPFWNKPSLQPPQPSTNQAFNQPTFQPTKPSTNQAFNQPSLQPTKPSTNQVSNQPSLKPTMPSTNQLLSKQAFPGLRWLRRVHEA